MTYTLSAGSGKKITVSNATTNTETSIEFLGKFKKNFEPILQQNLIHLLTHCGSKEYSNINDVPMVVGQIVYIRGTPPKMYLCTNDNPKTIEELVLSATDISAYIIPNSPPTGSVTISAVGKQYSAVTNTLADHDGLGVFSYQWYLNGVAITGATNSTYTIVTGDIGKTLKVEVKYLDQRKNVETVTSAGVVASDPTLTYIPTITLPTAVYSNTPFQIDIDVGTAPLGTGDTVNVTIQDANNYFTTNNITSFISNNKYGFTVAGGLNITAYTVTVTRLSGDNNSAHNGSASKSFNVIAKQAAATGTINITWDKGTAASPSTDAILTATPTNVADANGINQSTIEYKWYSGVSQLTNLNTDKSKYNVQASDLGKSIHVVYSFKDNLGNTENIISSQNIVVALGQVPVSGTLSLTYTTLYPGGVLTIDDSKVTDPNTPLTNKTYVWYRDNVAFVNNSTAYTITSADVNTTIKASMSYVDSLNNSETITTIGTPIPGLVSKTVTMPTYSIMVAGIGGESANTLYQPDAVKFCDDLSYEGYTDWRLPTAAEATAIGKQLGQYGSVWYYGGTDSNRFGALGSANSVAAGYSFPDYYWCSDYDATNKQYSWVYFNDSGTINKVSSTIGAKIGVRPVRTKV